MSSFRNPLIRRLCSSSVPDAPRRLTVFYDASCSVCDWEITHYKNLQAKHPQLERIDFQDISRCPDAKRVETFLYLISKYSDNHALLAQRSISQEQALDYFHGIACQPNAMHFRCVDLLIPASAITPEGNVVKGAGVIVEMWKRLPVFRFLAPLFESGIGSIVISSGQLLLFLHHEMRCFYLCQH
jgi:hypothetical protein